MNDPKTFNVPQRGFEFITPRDTQTRLVTRNANICTILLGVNEEAGLAFMCHLDSPFSVKALDKLAELIQAERGSFDGFELYAASSFQPWARLASALLVWGAALKISLIGGTFLLPVIIWWGCWTQLKCYWAAHRYFRSGIRWCWPSGCPSKASLKMGMIFDAAAPHKIDVTWDEKDIDTTPWEPKDGLLKSPRARHVA